MSDPHLPDTNENGAKDAAAEDRLVLTPALRVTGGAPAPRAADSTVASPPDEAALRAMVQQILREELAGPLGERITRGVRKLVRTEVAALLAARDPDRAGQDGP